MSTQQHFRQWLRMASLPISPSCVSSSTRLVTPLRKHTANICSCQTTLSLTWLLLGELLGNHLPQFVIGWKGKCKNHQMLFSHDRALTDRHAPFCKDHGSSDFNLITMSTLLFPNAPSKIILSTPKGLLSLACALNFAVHIINAVLQCQWYGDDNDLVPLYLCMFITNTFEVMLVR